MTLTHPKTGSKAQKIIIFLLHFMALCIFFALPEMLMSLDRRGNHPGLIVYVKPAMLVVVFYINYFLFFKFFRQKHGLLKILIANALLIGLINTASPEIFRFFNEPGLRPMSPAGHFPPPPPMRTGIQPPVTFDMHKINSLILFVLTAALGIAVRVMIYYRYLDTLHQKQLAQQRTEELQQLKAQLRPHFLFNAINTVYALIDVNPTMAKSALHRIGQLLRYVLYEAGEDVNLKQEVEFTENYVSIMKLRMTKAMTLNFSVDIGDYGNAMVPPLMFMTLMENAFKHGCTGRMGDVIDLSIKVNPEGILTCTTLNAVSGNNSTEQGHGVGVKNLQRRLELIYGNNAELTAGLLPDGLYRAELKIKLNKPNP